MRKITSNEARGVLRLPMPDVTDQKIQFALSRSKRMPKYIVLTESQMLHLAESRQVIIDGGRAKHSTQTERLFAWLDRLEASGVEIIEEKAKR